MTKRARIPEMYSELTTITKNIFLKRRGNVQMLFVTKIKYFFLKFLHNP
jgi:hypothetical protein